MDDIAAPTTVPRPRPVLELATTAVSAVVVLGGILARLTGLSRQSYWSDEIFSVNQSSGGAASMWHIGQTEIHPPFFAVCAWAWEHVGHSVHPGWMRLFPALCGVAALGACWHGLRLSSLTRLQRSVLLATTSACGLALVYSQDMRSYSLLLLASVGLTAASIRVVDTPPAQRPSLLTWTLWGMLASATHLFGGLLAGACAVLLWAFLGRRHLARLTCALALAELPQLLWLLHGLFTPGFDAGTTWIKAPHIGDVGTLFTSVFGIGRLTMQPDGFPLRSPWALVATAAVALLSLCLRSLGTGRESLRPTTSALPDGDIALRAQWRILAFLGALAIFFCVVLFTVSQVVHLWTLRNMIVMVPALAWGVCLALLLVSGPDRHQRIVAAALVLVSLAQLLGTAHAMRSPYKSQLSQAMERAAVLREQYPAMHVHQSRSSSWWLYSSSLPATPDEYRRIMAPYDSVTLAQAEHSTPAPKGVPVLYLLYVPSSESTSLVDQRILAHNRSGCRAEPFVMVAFVVCAP